MKFFADLRQKTDKPMLILFPLITLSLFLVAILMLWLLNLLIPGIFA